MIQHGIALLARSDAFRAFCRWIDAANEVVKGQGQYEWLEDKLLPENTPQFSNADIARLREARREPAEADALQAGAIW